ncbi:hypothetical protein INR49_007739 [Caranx melampygus]|nr:hypothetical protein INR49_007739 [Caranx melampygus]
MPFLNLLPLQLWDTSHILTSAGWTGFFSPSQPHTDAFTYEFFSSGLRLRCVYLKSAQHAARDSPPAVMPALRPPAPLLCVLLCVSVALQRSDLRLAYVTTTASSTTPAARTLNPAASPRSQTADARTFSSPRCTTHSPTRLPSFGGDV